MMFLFFLFGSFIEPFNQPFALNSKLIIFFLREQPIHFQTSRFDTVPAPATKIGKRKHTVRLKISLCVHKFLGILVGTAEKSAFC